MGSRGSRVQIPPSRLSGDQALQRLLLWGFFFAPTPFQVAPSRTSGGHVRADVSTNDARVLQNRSLDAWKKSYRDPPPARGGDLWRECVGGLPCDLPSRAPSYQTAARESRSRRSLCFALTPPPTPPRSEIAGSSSGTDSRARASQPPRRAR